jgi:hypothetical protein
MSFSLISPFENGMGNKDLPFAVIAGLTRNPLNEKCHLRVQEMADVPPP